MNMEALIMFNPVRLLRLQMILQRFSYLGIAAEIDSYRLIELCGLYVHLSYQAER